MVQRLTILGEAPSRTSTQPLDGQAGLRLALTLGLTDDELRAKVNLENLLDEWQGATVDGDYFPSREAQSAAREWASSTPYLIVCGRRLADALGMQRLWFEWRPWRGVLAAVIPHPSGRNRWWNHEANRLQFERWMRSVADLV